MDLDQQIAPAPAVDLPETLALDLDDLAVLRRRRDFYFFHFLEGLDADLVAQGGLGKTDRQLAEQVVARAFGNSCLP